MFIFLGILTCLIVLMVVVFFHELGHFFAAKLCGIKVHEFGIGIPPKIATIWTDTSGTIYTINALPIGGFVRLKGEEKTEEMNDPDSIVNKSIPKQMIVVLAGVIMNFLFAGIIFSILFMIGVWPIAINQQIETSSKTRLIITEQQGIDIGFLTEHGIGMDPLKGSIAEQAGLQKDDKILSINNTPIWAPQQFIDIIRSATGTLSISVERNNAQLTSFITPKEGKIGAYIYRLIEPQKTFAYRYGFFPAIGQWFSEAWDQTQFAFEIIEKLIVKLVIPSKPSERQEALQSLGGPIATGNLFINLLRNGVTFSTIIILAALISINLAIFNVLPFPALDGGRFFFLIMNAIISLFPGSKKISPNWERMIHLVGFILLMTLSLFIAFRDVDKLIGG